MMYVTVTSAGSVLVDLMVIYLCPLLGGPLPQSAGKIVPLNIFMVESKWQHIYNIIYNIHYKYTFIIYKSIYNDIWVSVFHFSCCSLFCPPSFLDSPFSKPSSSLSHWWSNEFYIQTKLTFNGIKQMFGVPALHCHNNQHEYLYHTIYFQMCPQIHYLILGILPKETS